MRPDFRFAPPPHHGGGPSGLAWAIFALQLATVLLLLALLVRSFLGPRSWHRREVVVHRDAPTEPLPPS
jgi:hypothetical protein